MRKSTTTHKTALANHAAATEKATEVRALLASTERDLNELQNVDVSQLLADPSKVARVARARTELAEQRTLQAEILEAAEKAITDAARAVVAAEADEVQPQIDTAEKDLSKWQARERELLEQLEAHVGIAHRRDELSSEERRDQITMYGKATLKDSKDQPLRRTIGRLRSQKAALLAASRGDDPSLVCQPEDLPESLQPGGILPLSSAVASAAEKAVRDAEQAEYRAEMNRDRGRLSEVASALGVRTPTLIEPAGYRPTTEAVDGWMIGNITTDSAETRELVRELAHLAGCEDALDALREPAGRKTINKAKEAAA